MGAVQKLATVVIIGLVALATVITVYIANEPDRRGGSTTAEQELAIKRGTDLYIKYCIQCHGPDGKGRDGNEANTRIGAPLNQDAPGVTSASGNVDFQSDSPADQALAEDFIHFRIRNGMPADPRLKKSMPAFGTELNGEEIDDLVYMIMHVDWDYVYNQAVTTTGEAVAQAECEANNGEGEYCGNIEEAPAVYPTAPPPAGSEESGDDEATPPANGGEEAAVTVEAEDTLDWSKNQLTVQPGDTIEVVPSAGLKHDFAVDEFDILADLSPGGDPVMVTIPDDAAPGDYTFYCTIPGHREAGMEGTLTIEAP